MAIDLFSIGGFTVHGYGLMIALGFLAAIIYASWQCKKKGLDDDFLFNLAILVLIFGWLGGKILYTIVEFKDFLENPVSVIASEGFVVYGGILTGAITIIVYCRIKKKNFFEYVDVIVAGVAINQSLGRIGCFLAGCCYGRETDSCIGVVFPPSGMAPSGVKLIPTQLISAAGDALLFLILFLVLNSKKYRKGMAMCIYLSGYAFGRAIVECFRADHRGSVGALSTSQFLSIFAGAAGLLVLSYILKKKPEDNIEETEKSEEESEASKEETGKSEEESETSKDEAEKPEEESENPKEDAEEAKEEGEASEEKNEKQEEEKKESEQENTEELEKEDTDSEKGDEEEK